MSNVRFIRDSLAMKNHVEFLQQNGKDFFVEHGTYTTTIKNEHGKHKFETSQFSDRVFIAAKLIRRDVLASKIGAEIMGGNYSKINFGHKQDLKPFFAPEVLNIDISSAYATCLLVNGLITKKTYDYLKRIKKEERLPSVGMLARSKCIWSYKQGHCTDIIVEREATAQVFFFLIQEINYIMQAITWELGKHFFFYWVDGVFFNQDTPKRMVTSIEKILTEKNYLFKYEKVVNFSLTKDVRDIFTIEMTKSDIFKRYQFSQNNDKSIITFFLNSIANNSL